MWPWRSPWPARQHRPWRWTSRLELDAKLSGNATVGTMLRMDDPSPDAYTYINSQVVGLPAGHLVGTTGAADMNFKQAGVHRAQSHGGFRRPWQGHRLFHPSPWLNRH